MPDKIESEEKLISEISQFSEKIWFLINSELSNSWPVFGLDSKIWGNDRYNLFFTRNFRVESVRYRWQEHRAFFRVVHKLVATSVKWAVFVRAFPHRLPRPASYVKFIEWWCVDVKVDGLISSKDRALYWPINHLIKFDSSVPSTFMAIQFDYRKLNP